jgi:hypothetical protein
MILSLHDERVRRYEDAVRQLGQAIDAGQPNSVLDKLTADIVRYRPAEVEAIGAAMPRDRG